jgi:hypothetical protein
VTIAYTPGAPCLSSRPFWRSWITAVAGFRHSSKQSHAVGGAYFGEKWRKGRGKEMRGTAVTLTITQVQLKKPRPIDRGSVAPRPPDIGHYYDSLGSPRGGGGGGTKMRKKKGTRVISLSIE